MIDTNALLAASFTLIARFHGVVKVSPDDIPRGREDIQRLVVGSPSFPTEVFLKTWKGTSYSIREGAVYRYQTTNSYSNLQDPALIPRFLGTAKLSSNDVVSLVAAQIKQLILAGGLADTPPRVSTAVERRGAPIPFYTVTWSSTNAELGFGATVEVDARNGEITYLWLRDACFSDPVLAQEIRDRVYTRDPEPAPALPRKKERVLPMPATNVVVQAIGAWVKVCDRLGMHPGSETNLADVDWDRSCVFTNRRFSSITPVCRVHFRNGAQVNAFRGAIISGGLEDKFYTVEHLRKRPEDIERFKGKVKKRPQDLAKGLESTLQAEFGFPTSVFSRFIAGPSVGDFNEEVGSEGVTRVVIAWRDWPDLHPTDGESIYIPISDTKLGFAVEFDTQTGEIKGFAFDDPELVSLFTAAQSQ